MAGLPAATSPRQPDPASGRLARAETIVAEVRGKRAQAAQLHSAARLTRERAVRERAQTESWLRSARANRQARRDAWDPKVLLAAGLTGSASRTATRRLAFFDADFCMVSDRVSIVAALLEAALTLSRAQRGNVQLREPAGDELRIAAQHGFESDFLRYFEVVDDRSSACGVALAEHRTVQVEDVARSEVFDGGLTREVVLSAGVRSVRSMPLLGGQGDLLGVMSVHYGQPHRPDAVEANILELLAGAAGRRLARLEQMRQP